MDYKKLPWGSQLKLEDSPKISSNLTGKRILWRHTVDRPLTHQKSSMGPSSLAISLSWFSLFDSAQQGGKKKKQEKGGKTGSHTLNFSQWFSLSHDLSLYSLISPSLLWSLCYSHFPLLPRLSPFRDSDGNRERKE
jgi:hypothetical protein